MVSSIGVGNVGVGGTCPSPLKFGKIFFGQLLCTVLAFFGHNHVKFGNFVKFLLILRVNITKMRVF